jgi:hypothetical protein
MATEFARMRQLFATTADWAANDIVLGAGEIGLELLASGEVWGKVGDGATTYSNLDYSIGSHVDLETDQSIDGSKTFIDPILIQNQADPTQHGQLWSSDFPLGVHALTLDAKGISSNTYIQARDNLGDPHTLTIGGDGNLRWDNVKIADDTGLAGVTWGGFDPLAVPTRGTGFSVSKPATGQYDLVFDVASVDGPSQSLVATANGQLAAGVIANVQMVNTTQATIWVFDSVTALPINSSVTFIRNFVPA